MVTVSVVYRPPHVRFGTILEDICNKFVPVREHFILLGNFNTDMCCDSGDKRYLASLMKMYDLHLVEHALTHHVGGSHTHIDHAWVGDRDRFAYFSQSPGPFQVMIESSWIMRYQSRTSYLVVRQRDFRGCGAGELSSGLETLDWALFYGTPSIDVKLNIFYENVNRILDEHAPWRTKVIGSRSAPWVRVLMRKRDIAKGRCKNLNTSYWKAQYGRLKGEVVKAVRLAKARFFSAAMDRARGSADVWRALRRLGVVGRGPEWRPLAVSVEELGVAFAEISSVLPESRGGCPLRVLDWSVRLDDMRFFFSIVTPAELSRAVLFARDTSAGTDSLHIRAVREMLPSVLPHILELVNYSRQSSVFPARWKLAVIRPIPKISAPEVASDYRPISLLCALSKVLETVAARRLTRFLEAGNALDPFQSAYRRKRRLPLFVFWTTSGRRLTSVELLC